MSMLITDEVLRTRIAQLVEQPNAPWLRHPLTAIVVGFVLTGIIGAHVARRIQERQDQSKQAAERRMETQKQLEDIREARRSAAALVFDSISTLLSRGASIYEDAAWSLSWREAFNDPDGYTIEAYKRDLKSVAAKADSQAQHSLHLVNEFDAELKARKLADNARVCGSFGADIA